jgi:hypothetical protein
MKIRVLTAVLVATLIWLTPACTTDAPDSPPPVETPREQAAEDYSGSAVVLPGTDPSAEGARRDVSDEYCKQSGDTWLAGGQVTNPTDAPRNYRVYVSYLDGAGETRALRQVDADAVAPGQARDWEASAELEGITGVRCVLRVERASDTQAPQP